MANSPPVAAVTAAAYIELTPGGTSQIADCAKSFNIPGMTQWCPARLLDVGQLTAYYHQSTLEAAYKAGYDFPNAIYIDAVAAGGLIRTGTRPLSAQNTAPVCDIYKWTSCQSKQPTCDAGWVANGENAHWDCYDYDGSNHGFCGLAWQNHYKCCRGEDSEHATDGYAYVDTLIAYNVRKACSSSELSSNAQEQCKTAANTVEARRARFARKVWSDAATGRLDNWPSALDTVVV
jgi:hypothetical protein